MFPSRIFISFLICYQYAIYAQDCGGNFNLQFGQQYFLQSPGFDQGKFYSSGMSCAWTFSTATAYIFDISCSPMEIPNTNNCNQDRLVMYLSGDDNGNRYCGSQPLKLASSTNHLKVDFVSAPYSYGGRFRCIITPIGGGGTPTTAKPPETTTKDSEEEEYCDCGYSKKDKIVGGKETGVNEYPFMAGLVNRAKKIISCGATIISERYALTAAHCVYDTSWFEFDLLVGYHGTAVQMETSAARIYALDDFIIHPDYVPKGSNDIAMARTALPMVFSMEIGPVCLPYRYVDVNFTNADVLMMGWGLTEFSGKKADNLQEVEVYVVSHERCTAAYNNGKVIDDTKMCTYADGKDACQLDSGGPVVWRDIYNTFRYQLLGIISEGSGCASSLPGINTNVSHYVNWILDSTPRGSYCFK